MYVDRWGNLSSVTKIVIVYQNGGGGGGNWPGFVTSGQIQDATSIGIALLTAPDAATARAAIGAGTGNGSGNGSGTVTSANITDATATGRSVLTGTAVSARSALGLGSASINNASDFDAAGAATSATSSLASSVSTSMGQQNSAIANVANNVANAATASSVSALSNTVANHSTNISALQNSVANAATAASVTALGNTVANAATAASVTNVANNVANLNTAVLNLGNSVANKLTGYQSNTNASLLTVVLPGDPVNGAVGANALLNVAQANFNAGIVMANSGANTNALSNGVTIYLYSASWGNVSFQQAGYNWYDDGDATAGIVFVQNSAQNTGYAQFGVPYASYVQTPDLPANTMVVGQKVAIGIAVSFNASNNAVLRSNAHSTNIAIPSSYNGNPKYPIYGVGGATWTREWVFAGQHNATTMDAVMAAILSGSNVSTQNAVLLAANGYVPVAFIDPLIKQQRIDYAYPGNLATRAGTLPGVFGVNGSIAKIMLAEGTAPTGANVVVDIKANGVSIFASNTSRPTYNINQNTATVSVPSGADAGPYGSSTYFTVDIDQIGSNVAGADLVVSLFMTPS